MRHRNSSPPVSYAKPASLVGLGSVSCLGRLVVLDIDGHPVRRDGRIDRQSGSTREIGSQRWLEVVMEVIMDSLSRLHLGYLIV